MTQIDLARQLYSRLAVECDLAMALVDVLFEEQACLVKLETDRLAELALNKEGLMLDLEKRFKANAHLAHQHGFEPSLDGLALWIDQLVVFEPKLQGTYSTLRTTLQQAQRLNTNNGELVTEQLAGLQERIAILTAAAVAEQVPGTATTYGPKGSLSNTGPAANPMPRAVIR